MTNFEMPSINGQSKDSDMPHTSTVRNGRFSGAQTAPPVQLTLTGWKVFNAAWSICLVLLYGGWVIVPAKDSDLKLVQKELVGVREDLQSFALDLRGVRADTQRNREELIRLGATADGPGTAAVAPRRVRTKVRTHTEAGTDPNR